MRIDAMQARVLKARRISYIFRRIDENFGQNPDTTSETEIAVLEQEGISAFLYFQRTDDRECSSRSQGIEDGGLALASCRVIGYPMGMPVFFQSGTDAYFGGVWEAIGDAHPFGVFAGVEHNFLMREEMNGSGEGKLERVQMA